MHGGKWIYRDTHGNLLLPILLLLWEQILKLIQIFMNDENITFSVSAGINGNRTDSVVS